MFVINPIKPNTLLCKCGKRAVYAEFTLLLKVHLCNSRAVYKFITSLVSLKGFNNFTFVRLIGNIEVKFMWPVVYKFRFSSATVQWVKVLHTSYLLGFY